MTKHYPRAQLDALAPGNWAGLLAKLDEGDTYAKQGRYDRAMDFYEDCIERDSHRFTSIVSLNSDIIIVFINIFHRTINFFTVDFCSNSITHFYFFPFIIIVFFRLDSVNTASAVPR